MWFLEIFKSEILYRSRNSHDLRFFIMCAAAIYVMFLFLLWTCFQRCSVCVSCSDGIWTSCVCRIKLDGKIKKHLFLQYPWQGGGGLAYRKRWSFCLKMRDSGNNVYRMVPAIYIRLWLPATTNVCKTRGCNYSFGAPDYERCVDPNMSSN
jgi:hypothetical protein